MAQLVKSPPTMQEAQVWSLGQEDPLEKEIETHSTILGKSHGQQSLVGYNPWGHKELDMTWRLNQTELMCQEGLSILIINNRRTWPVWEGQEKLLLGSGKGREIWGKKKDQQYIEDAERWKEKAQKSE